MKTTLELKNEILRLLVLKSDADLKAEIFLPTIISEISSISNNECHRLLLKMRKKGLITYVYGSIHDTYTGVTDYSGSVTAVTNKARALLSSGGFKAKEERVVVNRIFTMKEIEAAIRQSPKFAVFTVPAISVDDGLGGNIKTIEVDMFIFRLLGSNKAEYDKYINKK
jgi:hypothetical protein